jgi:hypothetical protein
MRQVLTVAALAAVGLLFAAPPAGAGAAKGPTLRSLQAQIKGLQKQVTKLKKRVATDENFMDASIAYSVCSTAVTADTFQDSWTGLDSYFVAHPGWAAYFGAQTPVNDYQACGVFSVVRAHNQRPPNSNVLRALLDIFKPSSSAAAHQGFMNLSRQHGYLFGQLFVLPR